MGMEHEEIRRLEQSDLSGAMELVWRVFLEFEAPEYAPEGVEEFRRYIELPGAGRRMAEGNFLLWGAFLDQMLVGVLAVVPPGCHISLLFVEKDHHRKGIAGRLLDAMLREHGGGFTELTVHASPYGAEAYRRMGFKDVAEEQTENGIRYVPMLRTL